MPHTSEARFRAATVLQQLAQLCLSSCDLLTCKHALGLAAVLTGNIHDAWAANVSEAAERNGTTATTGAVTATTDTHAGCACVV